MGNDNSKATIDNQQLIMQLQQQILQQQQQNNNVSRPIHIPKVNNVNPNANQPLSVPHILHNKDLLHKIDQNPVAKRKLLEKLLNEQSHVMSSQQIIKINSILNTLPPLSH